MLTPSKSRALGFNAAAEAIDQADVYGGPEAAAEAYSQNLFDTLGELGVKDGDALIHDAAEAFRDKLRAHGVQF